MSPTDIRNARVLAEARIERRMKLIADGTDNHMMMIDTVASFGVDSAAAQHIFDFNRQHGEQAADLRRSSPTFEIERHSSWHLGPQIVSMSASSGRNTRRKP